MKYAKAKEIGLACGLSSPEEHIGNIECHSTMLFEYSKIADELLELYEDAYALGVTTVGKMNEYYALMNDKLKDL